MVKVGGRKGKGSDEVRNSLMGRRMSVKKAGELEREISLYCISADHHPTSVT